METKTKLAIASAILTIILLVIVGRAGAEASRNRVVESTQPEVESTECEIEICNIQRTTEFVETPQIYDVPLSVELQLHIVGECERHGIEPTIIFAMIERESDFNPATIGDNGQSFGLMQIMKKWHLERMDRLGCSELLNPFENVTVGIDIFAELLTKSGDLQWSLMAYNGGCSYANRLKAAGIVSDYALTIIERAEQLKGSGN